MTFELPVGEECRLEWSFRVLGPVEAFVENRQVTLTGATRSLLAVLLTDPGKVISCGQISTGIWDHEPRSARKAVQSYVVRLRTAMAAAHPQAPAVVVTRAGGYLLDVPRNTVDTVRFERLLGEARRDWQSGAFLPARQKLSSTLELWRGEPFEDCPDLPAAEGPRARLMELHVDAVEMRVDVDLALGHGPELVAELAELVTRHPHREHFWSQLILSQYHAGRQGDALGTYRRARQVLLEEAGVEPGPELRQLEHAVLVQDPALYRTGLFRHGQIGMVVPQHLPPHATKVVGRAEELAQLNEQLEGAGPGGVIIAVDGGAGVGKTTLTVHWAHQLATRYPDGQLYVNLHGFDPAGNPMHPADAVRMFLEAFGVPPGRIPSTIEAMVALYRTVVADRRVLVLLDNARNAAQVRPLLPTGLDSVAIITSRNRLSSLATQEGAHVVTLKPFTTADATELLSQRLGPGRLAVEPDAVADLIKLCARLPLALAIVATRAATNPRFRLRDLANELRDERSRLDALDTDEPGASVRSVFSWSYQSLSHPAARMFRLLALHPGPDVGLSASASLAGLPHPDARRALGELTQAHLLEERASGRFAVHDLLQIYAMDQTLRLDTDQDRQEALRRLLDHYLHSTHSADRRLNPIRDPIDLPAPTAGSKPETFTDYAEALAWFDVERPALLALVSTAAQHGFDQHAWQLPWALATFLDRRSHWNDLAAAAETALTAARRLSSRPGQARAHGLLGRAHAWLRAPDLAHDHFGRALRLFEQTDDLANMALTHRAVAWVWEQQDLHAQALEHARRALDLYRTSNRKDGTARALNSVGWYCTLLGKPKQALTFCEEALALHQELDDLDGAAHTWDSIGHAHHRLGQHDQATIAYRHAIRLFATLGDSYYQAAVLVRLGDTQNDAGERHHAAVTWQQALEILTELRHPDAATVHQRLLELADSRSR
ncbi:AfsR/SARP family transcriptional regulator [Actinophytocola sp.]|uniref:AfsR/SARP family transcriptional regulator n=1 Tax=Actinophytocola sp. TaxID=1872138 RepID=UPI003899F4AA